MSKPRRSAQTLAIGRSGTASAAPWLLAVGTLAIGVFAGLIGLAPAHWLEPLVARTGHLQLVDARGTIWSGSARLMLTAGAGSREQAMLPERIEWSVRSAAMGLRLSLMARCCMSEPMALSLSLVRGMPQLNLTQHQSIWPADPLAALGTPLNTLKFAGRLRFQTDGLQWNWGAGVVSVQGRANLELQDLASALSTLKPMGHYRLAFEGGQNPHFTLSTVEGALQLKGQGQWQAGRLRFTGHASAQPGSEEVLNNVLNIVGRREGAQSIISFG
jgi:general secretion pathway protein N